MDIGKCSSERLVLVVAATRQDGRAITQALSEAGIESKLCELEALPAEVRAGVGAIILLEEAIPKGELPKLAGLLEEQPAWSDLPLVILTAPKRDASLRWRKIQSTTSIHNTIVLERPIQVETLLQTVRLALRGREQQFRVRDQILERERLLVTSEKSERRLSAVLNNTRMAVFFMNENQQCTFMNAAAEDLTGYSLAEVQGRSLHDAVHHSHPDGSPYPSVDCPIDRAFPENSQTEGEEVFVDRHGQFYPVAFTASPIRQENVVVGTVLEVRNISQQKADTECLHMLLNELNHRVKNTLSTVQSIFLQGLRGEPISDHARDAVMARLTALSRSHDLLTERNWVSAPLREIAWRALAPFGAVEDGTGKFLITGEPFELKPKTALSIAMAFHELGTNSVKYGALSTEGGRVLLDWKALPDGSLQLKWVEQGGPRVAPPTRSGFGRRLIEQGLSYELAGAAHIDFDPGGLICEIEIPIEKVLVAEKKRKSEWLAAPPWQV
jgi:PAS domain S-box-containing protein